MNKLMIVIASTFALTACIPEQNSYPMEQPTRVYEVDAWGTNPDIYEFTPKGYPDKTCLILVSGGDQSAGLECFNKGE